MANSSLDRVSKAAKPVELLRLADTSELWPFPLPQSVLHARSQFTLCPMPIVQLRPALTGQMNLISAFGNHVLRDFLASGRSRRLGHRRIANRAARNRRFG